MPMLSLDLVSGNHVVEITAIVDTGSPINVLPYSVGLALGFDWQTQRALGSLTGALSRTESRAIAVTARIAEIAGADGVPLLFAWADTDAVPILLGQTDFLMEFNVCFYRSENYFEVWPRDQYKIGSGKLG